MEAVHKEKEAKKEQRLREAGVPPPRPDEFGQAGGNVPRGVPPPPPPGPPPGGKFREKKKKQKGGSEKDWLVIFAVRYVLHIVLSYLRSVITCQALLVEFSSRVVFEFSTSRFFTITIFFYLITDPKIVLFFLNFAARHYKSPTMEDFFPVDQE
jgi:hypothetical protein